jgi:hypothetical protein
MSLPGMSARLQECHDICDDSFVSASSEVANPFVSHLCLCRSPMLYQSIFYHMEVGMNVKLNAIT